MNWRLLTGDSFQYGLRRTATLGYGHGMSADARTALEQLIAALERHYEVATARRRPEDPSVAAAATVLADALDDYDDALYESTGVPTPLAVYEGSDDDYDDDSEDDSDSPSASEAVDLHDNEDGSRGRVYSGLDDEDYDDDVLDEDDDDSDDEDSEDDEDDDDFDDDDEDEPNAR